ncbi:MAG: hypothetical protein F9K44_09595 [Hyphomicrobiaceae bacterium]|nr:MAG: hypothetical protein F9K44_09595 [Hyphomicrobiaceae bacterium]
MDAGKSDEASHHVQASAEPAPPPHSHLRKAEPQPPQPATIPWPWLAEGQAHRAARTIREAGAARGWAMGLLVVLVFMLAAREVVGLASRFIVYSDATRVFWDFWPLSLIVAVVAAAVIRHVASGLRIDAMTAGPGTAEIMKTASFASVCAVSLLVFAASALIARHVLEQTIFAAGGPLQYYEVYIALENWLPRLFFLVAGGISIALISSMGGLIRQQRSILLAATTPPISHDPASGPVPPPRFAPQRPL